MSPEWTGNLNFGIRFQSVVNFPCFSLCSRRFRQHASEREAARKLSMPFPIPLAAFSLVRVRTTQQNRQIRRPTSQH